MMRKIRVGSRESKLALVQTELIVNKIREKYPAQEFEIIGMKTKGDMILDKMLDKIGGKGLFVKELELALLDGSIDFAVHSMKDMPAEMPDELTIAAVSTREDPRDVLLAPGGKTLEELDEGAVVGTSSVRREVQILRKRPDLKIKTLRGNVLTRIKKLLDNEFDAIMLASAGLKRLGYEEMPIRYFEVDDVIPAVGQGILGVQARKDSECIPLLQSVHCSEAELCLNAERAYMIKLNGGCSTPIAAHAVIEGEKMRVIGMLASEDKTSFYRAIIEESMNDAAGLGERLADRIIEQMEKGEG